MVVSRRSFVKKGTLLVLGGGAFLGGATRGLGLDRSVESLDPQDLPKTKANSGSSLEFTKATFVAYLNTGFRIYPDASKFALRSTLVSVADIGPVPDQKRPGRECFVLRFRGSRPLGQDSYRIEHDTLGKFELFLVPAGKDRKGSYYQAVINRLNA